MWTQLIAGATINAINFAIHAVITALIVLATRHTARGSSEMGMFARLSSLLTIIVTRLNVCAYRRDHGLDRLTSQRLLLALSVGPRSLQ